MKYYDPKYNWIRTQLFGLEFFMSKNFDFSSEKHLILQLVQKTSTEMLAITYKSPFREFVIFFEYFWR